MSGDIWPQKSFWNKTKVLIKCLVLLQRNLRIWLKGSLLNMFLRRTAQVLGLFQIIWRRDCQNKNIILISEQVLICPYKLFFFSSNIKLIITCSFHYSVYYLGSHTHLGMYSLWQWLIKHQCIIRKQLSVAARFCYFTVLAFFVYFWGRNFVKWKPKSWEWLFSLEEQIGSC